MSNLCTELDCFFVSPGRTLDRSGSMRNEDPSLGTPKIRGKKVTHKSHIKVMSLSFLVATENE